MEKIIKEFSSITKVEEVETYYTFQAVIKPSYEKPYRIRVKTKQYKQGTLAYYSNAELFFNNSKEMTEEFKYHYNLNKNSLFTQFIKITK